MNFKRENLPAFFDLFSKVEDKIRNLPGCYSVELKQNISEPEQLITISKWDSEEHLNSYRDSELFRDTWSKTKKFFSGKAIAISLGDELNV